MIAFYMKLRGETARIEIERTGEGLGDFDLTAVIVDDNNILATLTPDEKVAVRDSAVEHEVAKAWEGE